jgi:hypothetical protein
MELRNPCPFEYPPFNSQIFEEFFMITILGKIQKLIENIYRFFGLPFI